MKVLAFLLLGAALAGCGSSASTTAEGTGVSVTAPSPTAVPPLALPPPGTTPIQLLAQGNVLTAQVFRLAAGQRGAQHFHPAQEEALYLLTGSGQLQLGSSTVPLKTGDFVFIPAGVSHSLTADAGQDLAVYSDLAPGPDVRVPGESGLTSPTIGPLTLRDVAVPVAPGASRGDVPLALGRQLQTGLVKVPAGKTVPQHFHLKHEEAVLVLAGTGEFGLEGQTYPIKPGDFFFMPIGAPHALTAGPDADVVLYCQTAPPTLDEDRFFGSPP